MEGHFLFLIFAREECVGSNPTTATKEIKMQNSYWYVGSPAWCHYFKKVEYKNGDVVWISKLTGKGYAGVTHDGLKWNSITEVPKS